MAMTLQEQLKDHLEVTERELRDPISCPATFDPGESAMPSDGRDVPHGA